jgi:hypothetical protein
MLLFQFDINETETSYDDEYGKKQTINGWIDVRCLLNTSSYVGIRQATVLKNLPEVQPQIIHLSTLLNVCGLP